MTVPAAAIDDYFDARLDALNRQVTSLIEQMERWSEDQAQLFHRLDLLENTEPLENMENHRGY